MIVFDPKTAQKFMMFLGFNDHINAAHGLIAANKQEIEKQREYFSDIRERDLVWFREKFPFKDYDVLK